MTENGQAQPAQAAPVFHVLVVDLAGKDDFGLCAEIRGNRMLPHMPILIVSDESSPENVGRAARLHINGFLTEPFTGEALCQRALKLLYQGNAGAARSK